LKCWKGSDPKKYAAWFEQRSQYRMYKIAAARDAVQPLPALEGTSEKEVLQLVVQLLKRWRDLFYSEKNYPPISVVLTIGGEVHSLTGVLSVIAWLQQLRGSAHTLPNSDKFF
jgi:hypothetical protein